MPLLVEKITNGTVIDRIEPGRGIRVMQALGLDAHSGRIALVVNVPSHHMGHKDILKVEGVFLDPKALNKLALISPRVRINLIIDSKVSKKQDVSLPDVVVGVAKCPNPKCITNSVKVETSFKRAGAQLRCFFCERLFDASELI